MPNPTFLLWKCCLTGMTRPTLKKTPSIPKPQIPHMFGNSDEKPKKEDLEVDSGSIDLDEQLSSPKYDQETESGFNDADIDDSTFAPSEVESTTVPSSTVQIVKEGNGDSTPQNLADIGTGGRLHLNCSLEKKTSKIHINIKKIEFGPYQNWKMEDLEVNCMLLPMHQQSFRRRSKRFNEPIVIQLPKSDKLSASSLRFRVYDHKSITSKYLIGEGQVNTESLFNPDGSEVSALIDLNAPGVYSIDTRYTDGIRSVGDSAVDSPRPEVLVSLEYRGLTRKLIVEVVKTRGLGLLSGAKPQDVAVEVALTESDKHVVKNCRTAVKKHVIDTEFNELFMFRLSKERLSEVTLQLTVVRFTETAGIRNKKVIGECSFGLRSSGNEQQQHWDALTMPAAKTEYYWHPLYQ